ncbi:MAG: YgiT-type zinc finger protein [Bacteroidales bacterium]|nr:YgiT-type zinc finger protein [Bacteroidales bacterium]
MKCQRCGYNAIKTKTSSVTDLGDVLIIIRNVPCYQCEHCDEIIYTGDVVANLEKIIAAAKALHQEISVIDYMKNAA